MSPVLFLDGQCLLVGRLPWKWDPFGPGELLALGLSQFCNSLLLLAGVSLSLLAADHNICTAVGAGLLLLLLRGDLFVLYTFPSFYKFLFFSALTLN